MNIKVYTISAMITGIILYLFQYLALSSHSYALAAWIGLCTGVLAWIYLRDWIRGRISNHESDVLAICPYVRISTFKDLWTALETGPDILRFRAHEPGSQEQLPAILTILYKPLYLPWSSINLMIDLPQKWREELISILTQQEKNQ